MKTRPLLILGDGQFAVEALGIAEAAGGPAPAAFVNSLKQPESGASLEGLPVFWVDDLPFGPGECDVVCAIVTTERRPFIELMRSRGYRFRSLASLHQRVATRSDW